MTNVTRAQKFRLGVFVAAGLFVLIGGLVVLAGLRLVESRDRYVIRYREAAVSLSGLDVGSPVKYSGIRVGRVDSVRIDPNDVSVIVVEISLDGGTPVAEDTRANLGSQGITGLKYIELTRGSARARIRKPGDDIPAGTSFLDSLTDRAEEITNKVNLVLDRVAVLSGPDMKDRLARVLDRTESLLGTLDATLTENRESLKLLAEKLAGTAEQVERLSSELAGSARRANLLLDHAAAMVKNSRDTPERLNAFLEQAAAVLGPDGAQRTLSSLNGLLAQSRNEVLEAIGYLRETAENVSALSQKLRDDPSLLIRSGGDEDEGE